MRMEGKSMTLPIKPGVRPASPNFSSGPCSKRPGWSIEALSGALTGRSHRSAPGKAKLAEVIDRTRSILNIPQDYKIGIVPASDTGAVEMALWSLLGERGVNMLAWESFGKGWVNDVVNQLKVSDVRVLEADYGEIVDLASVDFSHDTVFTWNGTTSGVRVPDGDWIPSNRAGLTVCDATSAVFAMDLPWSKLDATTWSWQKVMGGEAAHGMLVLSPRAVARLESYTPDWPLPKIFRMTKNGKLIEGVFLGQTLNTPSMIAVEDALDGLRWAEKMGGLKALTTRSQNNLKAIETWVEGSGWADFLVADATIRSSTSVCLKIIDSWFVGLDDQAKAKVTKHMVSLLSEEEAAYDLGAYRDAPAGLRIWAGATIEVADLEALFPWLDWSFATTKANF